MEIKKLYEDIKDVKVTAQEPFGADEKSQSLPLNRLAKLIESLAL